VVQAPALPESLTGRVAITGITFAEEPAFDASGNFYFVNHRHNGAIAARMTPVQRSESARKSVLAWWAKTKDSQIQMPGAASGPGLSTSKRTLHACLDRLKRVNLEDEIRRLTEELQRIVFHRQYQNAED